MAKLIILVAYSAADAEELAHALAESGHEVVPILGNSDALRQRDQFAHADAVVLGETDDQKIRQKFAQWVKQNFPQLRLVCMGQEVAGAQSAARDVEQLRQTISRF